MSITMYFVTGNNRKWFNFKSCVQKYAENLKNDIDFERLISNPVSIKDEKSVTSYQVLDIIKDFNVPIIIEHMYLEINGGDACALENVLNYNQICKYLKGENACSYQSIAYTFGKEIVNLDMVISGKITDQVNGEDYFAWYPLFIPESVDLDIKINGVPLDNNKIQDYKNTYLKIDNMNTLEKQSETFDNKIQEGLYIILFKLLKIDLEKTYKSMFELLEIQNEKNLKELKNKIKQNQIILFVGAGVSRTLGLVGWKNLIKAMGKELGFDEEIFVGNGNDFLTLAEYYSSKKSIAEIIKTEFIEKAYSARNKLEKSNIYKYIYDLNFPIIYTTNYDDFIEVYYDLKNEKGYLQKSFKIVNIRDCQNIDDNKTAIIKLHGDYSNLKDLVLSEESFYTRIDLNHPLDTLFKADMLKKSVLFIGYGLADINVKNWINKLNVLWNNNIENRNKSYFYNHCFNSVQAEMLEKKGIQTICPSFHPYSIKAEDMLKNFVSHNKEFKWIDDFIYYYNSKCCNKEVLSYGTLANALENKIDELDKKISTAIKKEELGKNKKSIETFSKEMKQDYYRNIYCGSRCNGDDCDIQECENKEVFQTSKKMSQYKQASINQLLLLLKLNLKRAMTEKEKFLDILDSLTENIKLLESNPNSLKKLDNIVKHSSNCQKEIEMFFETIKDSNISVNDLLSEDIIYNYFYLNRDHIEKSFSDHNEESFKKIRRDLTCLLRKSLYIDLSTGGYYNLAMEKFLKTLLDENKNYNKFNICLKLLIKDQNEDKYMIFKRKNGRKFEHTWETYGKCLDQETECLSLVEELCKNVAENIKIHDKNDVITISLTIEDSLFSNLVCVNTFLDDSCKTLLLTFLVKGDLSQFKINDKYKVDNDQHEAFACHDYTTLLLNILPEMKNEFLYYDTKKKIDEIEARINKIKDV